MPLAAGFAELVIDLAAALTALHTPWNVFGAQAALMWGCPRLTTDVNATVRLGGIATDAGPGLEDLFLERAIPVEVSGTTVPFISPEDLIVTTILAGRPKDIDDIRGVLAERGALLKTSQIQDTLALLEDALGQSDLRPVFETEFARRRSER